MVKRKENPLHSDCELLSLSPRVSPFEVLFYSLFYVVSLLISRFILNFGFIFHHDESGGNSVSLA